MEEKTLKTALITGASGGLGRETSNLLLKAGYRVIALDIDSEPLLKNMNQNNLFFRQMDASDP
ncbi:MAG: SDR family NAD(P)-dependent oxidoreductase, partial [Bacteroidales bacterium]|nr:SDR family NAD(P)-dependent oxidoreductase [Bacteroidales bacterium]